MLVTQKSRRKWREEQGQLFPNREDYRAISISGFSVWNKKMTMQEIVNGGFIEEVAIVGGLVGVQFVYAGNSVLLSYLMSLGLSALTIVIFTSLATSLILFPAAFYFERSRSLSLSPLCLSKRWRPKELNFYLLCFVEMGENRLLTLICICCRTKWPKKFRLKLFLQLLLLSFGG